MSVNDEEDEDDGALVLCVIHRDIKFANDGEGENR